MNVLHVYRTYFPDPPGGLQEAIKQIAIGAKIYGVDIKVFALSPNPNPSSLWVDNIEVLRAKSWVAPSSCDLGGFKAIRLFKDISEWADVVHFHFPWPYADLLNFVLSERVIRVMTYHSDIVRQQNLGRVYRPLMLRTLRSMDAVVATSPNYFATSPVLSKHVPYDKLKIIPLGIADRASDVHGVHKSTEYLGKLVPNGEPFVLALGVLRYYKGCTI